MEEQLATDANDSVNSVAVHGAAVEAPTASKRRASTFSIFIGLGWEGGGGGVEENAAS